MNIWHDINPKQITTEEFIAVIEIPKNSKVKYELNKETGVLEMDRILYTSTHYPANYGFIPRTYADDGDPLDVLVLCSQNIYPMTLVRCYPIGVIRMIDNGRHDDKIIAATRLIIPMWILTSCPAISLKKWYISLRYTRNWNTSLLRSMKFKMQRLQRKLSQRILTIILKHSASNCR